MFNYQTSTTPTTSEVVTGGKRYQTTTERVQALTARWIVDAEYYLGGTVRAFTFNGDQVCWNVTVGGTTTSMVTSTTNGTRTGQTEVVCDAVPVTGGEAWRPLAREQWGVVLGEQYSTMDRLTAIG